MKRIGWKVLAGPTSTYVHASCGDPAIAIDMLVQKYMKDGWICKGEMRRVHPTSTLWTQIIEKYAP